MESTKRFYILESGDDRGDLPQGPYTMTEATLRAVSQPGAKIITAEHLATLLGHYQRYIERLILTDGSTLKQLDERRRQAAEPKADPFDRFIWHKSDLVPEPKREPRVKRGKAGKGRGRKRKRAKE